MKVKYTGELPCTTIDPPADWQPGEVKEVESCPNNPLFEPAPPEEIAEAKE